VHSSALQELSKKADAFLDILKALPQGGAFLRDRDFLSPHRIAAKEAFL